jgi:hypothetical protein
VPAAVRGFGSAGHLARRFAGALWPGGPNPADERWARQWCSDAEAALWSRLSGPDRRHAVGVARRVVRAGQTDRPVVAAALLHDIGKVVAGLGTYGRVIATAAGLAAGPQMAESWSQRRGFTRRAGLYLRHDELGAEMLAVAGSDPLTVTWAREHHLPAERWTLPQELARILKDADDE